MKNSFLFLICIIISIVLLRGMFFSYQMENTFSEIAENMGYDVEKTPYEIVRFTIPDSFDEVYSRYNDLLKKGGFDLEKYKGRECERYTYLIRDQNARANIIVCDGEVIGGDISSVEIDGKMIPVKKQITAGGIYEN